VTVSALASVDPAARLGADVSVGPFSVVHGNVELGAGTVIDSHCVIGEPSPGGDAAPLRIGAGSRIRSHSVIYDGSTFGPRLETGHRVTLREGLTVGENLRAGTLCDLQGDATLGDFVRLHSNVHIGKHSVLGDFVWIFPYVVLTNDPHPPSETQLGAVVEDYAVVATMSVLLPGTRVGRGAVVSAGAVVTRDIEPGVLAVGSPAKAKRPASEIELTDRPGVPAYPWRGHFHRGYPADVVARWQADGPPTDRD
jgi:acetyltransferase-like isoleucine patch superfamily enzyme